MARHSACGRVAAADFLVVIRGARGILGEPALRGFLGVLQIGEKAGCEDRARICCCRANRPKGVAAEAAVGIPEIIAGDVDVLPADRGKVGKQGRGP